MSPQERVIALLDKATPKEKLKKWVMGYIPEHYKRISISMDEAVELAKIGQTEAKVYFGNDLFFTQAVLFGAVASGRYKTFIVVTSSQYGKSWLCGQIAIWLADKGKEVHVAGGNDAAADIIMNKVIGHLQNVHPSVQEKLIGDASKIEKLQTATSKDKIAMKGGGSIDKVSLGATINSSNSKLYNKAVGRGGAYIVDEAGLIPDDNYAEMGRREFSSVDGKSELMFQISNPHQKGTFYDKLISDNVPEGTLVIWMDIRTALEEGRVRSIEQIESSDFFKNNSTCQRYLLCELASDNDSSMFPDIPVDDGPIKRGCKYYFGIDAAYKGKDKIKLSVIAMERSGNLRILTIEDINKGKQWIMGQTSKFIINQIMDVSRKIRPRYISVDIGFGAYIAENIAGKGNFRVEGVNFGAGTSKTRTKKRHFAAVYGDNMRSEMHLDLQNLIQTGKISCTSEVKKQIKEEMDAVTTITRTNGKIGIISKDQVKAIIGHSPDSLDSVLLGVHSAIADTLTDAFGIYS